MSTVVDSFPYASEQSMCRPLRIAVADDERDVRDYFRKMLPRLGHEVVAVAENGRQLLSSCRELTPDLLFTDVRMPELDGIDALDLVFEFQPLPAILVSALNCNAAEPRIDSRAYSAQLRKPFKLAELKPAIEIALLRFEQFRLVHQEAPSLPQAKADFVLVDQAKRKLMQQHQWDERTAFDQLAEDANRTCLRVVEIASALIVISQ